MKPPIKPVVQVATVLKNLRFAAPTDEPARAEIPLVFELLAPQWTEGKLSRQAGRLTLKADGGAWRLSIECPTEGVQTTIFVSSLTTAILDAEAAIGSGKAHFGPSWQTLKKHLPVVDDVIK